MKIIWKPIHMNVIWNKVYDNLMKSLKKKKKEKKKKTDGESGSRTRDVVKQSQALYQLSYGGCGKWCSDVDYKVRFLSKLWPIGLGYIHLISTDRIAVFICSLIQHIGRVDKCAHVYIVLILRQFAIGNMSQCLRYMCVRYYFFCIKMLLSV